MWEKMELMLKAVLFVSVCQHCGLKRTDKHFLFLFLVSIHTYTHMP